MKESCTKILRNRTAGQKKRILKKLPSLRFENSRQQAPQRSPFWNQVQSHQLAHLLHLGLNGPSAFLGEGETACAIVENLLGGHELLMVPSSPRNAQGPVSCFVERTKGRTHSFSYNGEDDKDQKLRSVRGGAWEMAEVTW